MVVKIGDVDMDTSNISPADVENLRQMLPVELEQQGKLSQLEIMMNGPCVICRAFRWRSHQSVNRTTTT